MSTRFYYGQKDYIVQLNAMDDIATASATSAKGYADAAAASAAAVQNSGWGTAGTTPALANLDDTTSVSGMYYVNGATGTFPAGAGTTGTVLHKIYGTNGLQIYQANNADRMFWRRLVSGTWQAWNEYVATANPTFSGNITTGRTTNVFANAEPGNFIVNAPNASGTARTWGQVRTIVTTPTQGSEASALTFSAQKSGVLTESMRIDSTGNVGVGVVAPSEKLQVGQGHIQQDNNFYLKSKLSAGTPIRIMGINATNNLYLGSADAAHASTIFINNSNELARIDATGNMGVGAVPQAWFAPALQVKATGISESSNGGEYTYNAYRSAASTWNAIASGGAARYGQAGDHRWYVGNATAGAAITWNQAMTLDSTGKLGLGTATPSTRLHVVGGSSGALTLKHNYNFSDVNWALKLDGDTGTAGGYVGQFSNLGGVSLASGGYYYGGGPWVSDSATANFSAVNIYQGVITFNTITGLTAAQQFTPPERMRINAVGDIGIGTNAPSKYSHGGSGRVVELFNPDTALNSQSHLILSSGATLANSSIGSLSFTMPNTSVTNTKLMAYVNAWTDASHTSAAPSCALTFATRTAGGNVNEQMRLDGSGNIFMGKTAGLWATVNRRVIEVDGSTGGSLVGLTVNGSQCGYIYGMADYGFQLSGYAYIQFATSAGEKARIDNGGNLLVGVTSGSNHSLQKNVTAAGQTILTLQRSDGGAYHRFMWADSAAWNAQNAAMAIGSVSATGRSITAAGSVIGGGQDYAEYMPKAGGCGIVAKGQIIGIDEDGKITDKWATSISFMVKTTDPSFVGGDRWGTEEALGMQRPELPAFMQPVYDELAEGATEDETNAAREAYNAKVEAARAEFDNVTMPAYEVALATFEARLEDARQKVDRIAYCGQVPVNVTGAKPGQYVVPVQDGNGIKGILVNEDDMTLKQYMKAVGVVQNILDDGRANIRVKPV